MSGRVFTGADVGSDREITADVVIVGSGAGGAVSAAVLAQAGAKVVILEEGGLFTRKDFDMREDTALQHLYQERGNRATHDLSMVILQGRNVGGGTTVNWTTSFRTPQHVLEHWEDTHGVEGFTWQDLLPAFESVEERLSIDTIDEKSLNANNQVLWRGARKLGYQPELLRRNVVDCLHTGSCGQGCPTNAKQAMHRTYLPDAVAAGADLYADCRVQRLVAGGQRIRHVQAVVMNREEYEPSTTRVTVTADKVIVSGGAINSPALLLRSGLDDSSGLTGKRTFFHPVTPVVGEYEDPIEGYYGAPQGCALHDGLERGDDDRMGYFIETPPIHPLLSAMATAGQGENHAELMTKLSHVSALIALHIDGFAPEERGGTVTVTDDGRILVSYHYTDRFWRTMRHAVRTMARIHLAAGAKRVATTHERMVHIRTESQIDRLEELAYAPLKLLVISAHQMGGCQMGGKPETSVVSSELKHWSYDNLYVIDGSVFPTASGVNPSETIYSIATLAAGRIAANG